MKMSLNEIEQTVLKAARGAGCAWGDAEEIAVAARWLALNRLAWIARLVIDLEAGPGAHSAVFLGPALCEPQALTDGIAYERIASPIWLAAHVAGLAAVMARCVALSWDAASIVVDGDGHLRDSQGHIDVAVAAAVVIRLCAASGSVTKPVAGARDVDAALWARLEDLAARTCVPASDQSRSSGAGAGNSDND